MKKLLFISSILVVMAITVLGPVHGNSIVHAQTGGCTDAAGGPVPCPTEDPNSGSGGGSGGGESSGDNSGGSTNPGGGNPNPPSAITATPTAASTPEPTVTPLPFGLPDRDYLGSCTNKNFSECKAQFECEDGLLVVKVDLYSGSGTKYDFYCIPHSEVPTLDLPIALPTPNGSTEENWDGFCIVREGQTLEDCSNILKAACDEDGGDYYEEASEDGSSLSAYCQNSSESNPAPTEAPVIAAAPTDDGSTRGDSWDESCTVSGCYGLALWCSLYDGGTGYALEDGNGGFIYHCDLPEEEEKGSIPPGGWLLGAIGLGIGLVYLGKALNRRVECKLPY